MKHEAKFLALQKGGKFLQFYSTQKGATEENVEQPFRAERTWHTEMLDTPHGAYLLRNDVIARVFNKRPVEPSDMVNSCVRHLVQNAHVTEVTMTWEEP